MTEATEFADRCVVATLILVASVGVGACATTTIKDLQFVSMRKIEPLSPPLQRAAKGGRILDLQFVEATLSTRFDFVAAANSKDGPVPYAREWQCARGWDDDFPQYFYDVYKDGKRVGRVRAGDMGEIATPGNAKQDQHFYTIYFPVRAGAEDFGALGPTRSAYDLEKAPADVCVEFGTAGYYNTSSIGTNIVTIPAYEFEKLFRDRQE